jgi:hypothetical protein
VARLNDVIDREAGIAAIAIAADRSEDPAEVLAGPGRIARSILEHCADVIRALVTGAAAEPDLAVVLGEGHRRHVEGAARFVGRIAELDGLAPTVDQQWAVDTLAAISDVEFGLLLLDSYGWSLDRIEAWITASGRSLLLRT